jgi:hypothetical protein
MSLRFLLATPFLLASAVLCSAPMVPLAQESGLPSVGGGGATNTFQPMGFGSPSPVLMPRMRQSVSMSYASDGTRSVSRSLYMNEMSWRLSDPWTLHLDLGLSAPLYASGPGSDALRGQTAELYPRLGLEWRPSESTVMMLSVARSPYASWTDPWNSMGRAFPEP